MELSQCFITTEELTVQFNKVQHVLESLNTFQLKKGKYKADFVQTNIYFNVYPKDIYLPSNHYTKRQRHLENLKRDSESSELHQWMTRNLSYTMNLNTSVQIKGENHFKGILREQMKCDAFDSDVDEGPITQTMFMTNLTSEDRIYDEAGTSYDSNTLLSIDNVIHPILRSSLSPEFFHLQVKKDNLYVPQNTKQLFTEFETELAKLESNPTALEGERGFEQTKRCYLTEVIPFFKTLKEHFVGVQTALFKEVKEMEEIFDQMNNEVDKNTIDKQCAEIEKKNLLIENENLIVNCLSTQLLYDVEKSRCLDLEADMSKVHDESKHISKLEGECLNLQLKYQHLQESFDNNKSHTVQEAPDFNSFFKIKNLEHQIQEKDTRLKLEED
ncbi:hypothetical protein Tco_1031368 [Tanacetum coccineum]|uniref:Uncharacterized protein n=1 Tax=Tanacetum coccineum TaxID=301880 RepID=A0ABQ5GB25_9ASTR